MSSGTPRAYVFYDYVCPYAYLGKLRADRLADQYDVRFVYLPWEIYPDTNPAGEPRSHKHGDPSTRRWLDELADEMGVELASPIAAINANLALRGAEYAKDQGTEAFARYHALAFEAVWRHGRDLGDVNVLRDVVDQAALDPDAFLDAIDHHAYQYRLDLIDEFALKLGIQRVPTFVFGDQRIVGNDRFGPSLRQPLAAFLERRKTLGDDHTTTLEEDVGLARVL